MPRNWPAYDGGPILRGEDGGYSLEYILSPEGSDLKYWEVYQVDLDREPLPNWVDAEGAAHSIGISASILKRRWRSKNVVERAHARVDVAGYHGWHNLDDYPLRLKKREVELRYRRRAT